MIAYRNDPSIKDAILKQLEMHRLADEIVKGVYWEDGKGCAVGCTIHSDNHMEYEARFGIPVMLARLEDRIFEGLPNADAMIWPKRFMSAVRPGSDMSRVGWKFQHWLLTDKNVNPGIDHPLVKAEVAECARIVGLLCDGFSVDQSAARSAERSAESAAWSAARSAESAASAAWSAARSAESAASAAWSAARSAESAAWSAAWSAERSAESAAWSAAWRKMADKFIELIEAAPDADRGKP
jgi:hypothetical protein